MIDILLIILLGYLVGGLLISFIKQEVKSCPKELGGYDCSHREGECGY